MTMSEQGNVEQHGASGHVLFKSGATWRAGDSKQRHTSQERFRVQLSFVMTCRTRKPSSQVGSKEGILFSGRNACRTVSASRCTERVKGPVMSHFTAGVLHCIKTRCTPPHLPSVVPRSGRSGCRRQAIFSPVAGWAANQIPAAPDDVAYVM